ncbi:MAG: hypothetical protein JO244_06695 [Solirubrobacterales bacterium]|nr:hypothetical protein [Solirubrobacterales bacterium]
MSTGANPEGPSETRRFLFRFDPRYARMGRPFGVSPERAWVEVTGNEFRARFGRWRFHTSLDNVASVELTGPYELYRTAGPARLGVTDLGLTFATNGDRGVLITFKERVPGIEPLGLLRHGELTVTVAEPEELAALLARRSGGRLA